MATVGESLRANIRIGGNIDPSWRHSVTDLKEGIGHLGKRTRTLSAEQDRLALKIRKAALAGQDLTELRKRYEKLTQKIKVTTSQQEAFNRSLERAERRQKWAHRGGAALGGMKSGALWAGGGLLATGAAAVTMPVMLNQKTAEEAGIARSVGVDHSTYTAWDGMAKQAGLNGENVVDLAEELKNKVGEYKKLGKQSSMSDAFEMLGFRAEDFKGMNNQQMMNQIFDRASTLKDEQVAASAVDMLMGGEANKFITWVRSTNKNFSELEQSQRKYNLMTQAGVDGAIEGDRALNNLWTVVTSAAQEVSGVLGHELAPAISHVTDDLTGWFKGGGMQSIKSTITDFIIPGIFKFGEGAVLVGSVLFRAAKVMSDWLPDDDDEQRAVLETLGKTGSVDAARKVAQNEEQTEWFEELLKRNPDIQGEAKNAWRSWQGPYSTGGGALDESMDKYLTSKASPLSDLATSMQSAGTSAPSVPAAPSPLSALAYTPGQSSGISIRSEPRINATFNITQNPGEDGSALANRVTGEFGKMDYGMKDLSWE